METSTQINHFQNVRHGFCNRFDTAEHTDVILPKQIHSFTVLSPDDKPLVGDALVTDKKGVKISVKTADCAPVLMTDGKVIAAVHAGFKGAVTGIIETALIDMLRLGANLSEIRAAIGPCIHEASYLKPELGGLLSEDVMQFWPEYPDGVRHFNLPLYVRYRLMRSGVQSVDVIDVDTYTNRDYNSYRREPENPARQYSWIELI